MSITYTKSRPVVAGLNAQIEALAQRPGLSVGLPCPLPVLETGRDKLAALERKQEAAKAALKLATDAVQQALFELKGKLGANRASAAMIHGPHSPEFIVLGGKPRKGRRKPVADAAPVADPSPAADAAPASSSEAK